MSSSCIVVLQSWKSPAENGELCWGYFLNLLSQSVTCFSLHWRCGIEIGDTFSWQYLSCLVRFYCFGSFFQSRQGVREKAKSQRLLIIKGVIKLCAICSNYRWLISKGRETQAKELIYKIAKRNSVALPETIWELATVKVCSPY